MDTTLQLPVVAGVDDAAAGASVIRLATAEATLRGRPLLLISVRPSRCDGPTAEYPDEAAERRPATARSTVPGTHPGLSPSTRLEAGELAEVLIDASRGAELVVVGDTGTSATSERVAAHASAPVLVTRAELGNPGGPVLVGVDGANPWPSALAFAFEEAAYRGATLMPVYVWSGVPDTALTELDPFAYDLQRAADEADRVLAEAVAGWSDKYPQVRVERLALLRPDPVQALVQTSHRAALLVVSACSHVGRSEQLLGTVTRQVLHRAACPVAVLR